MVQVPDEMVRACSLIQPSRSYSTEGCFEACRCRSTIIAQAMMRYESGRRDAMLSCLRLATSSCLHHLWQQLASHAGKEYAGPCTEHWIFCQMLKTHA